MEVTQNWRAPIPWSLTQSGQLSFRALVRLSFLINSLAEVVSVRIVPAHCLVTKVMDWSDPTINWAYISKPNRYVATDKLQIKVLVWPNSLENWYSLEPMFRWQRKTWVCRWLLGFPSIIVYYLELLRNAIKWSSLSGFPRNNSSSLLVFDVVLPFDRNKEDVLQ